MLSFRIASVISSFLIMTPFVDLEARDSDSTKAQPAVSTERPVVEAFRVTNPIKIDGKLTETDYQRPGITHFTQRDPVEGVTPRQKTEVWVSYDDEALYVSARLYDTAPDSIIARMGRRDASLNTDWFYIGLDSYHDRRSGFYFIVCASGAIGDGTIHNNEWEDDSWDGIWDVATTIDEKGWALEARIPYSQLRFPKQEEYVWGVNFVRQIERTRERCDFVMVPKKESGWASRFADLTGIKNIHPPARLEFLPYVVSSTKLTNQYTHGNPFNDGTLYGGNFGADFKIGLGNNLTLNGTVNPDFGQVEVDPAVVNLSQFETFFNERRPFFVEGSNFFDFGSGGANNNWGFNFGSPDYFYSRRIGRTPRGWEQHSDDDGQGDLFTDYPDRTHIIGAAKLTGKVADSWSIGTMNAFTAREFATVDSAGTRFDEAVEPFTYYGVVRSLREFNEGHQAIGFIGTATMRDFNKPYLVDNFNHQSYAFGVDGWTNLDSNQTWVLTGWMSTTRVNGTTDRILTLQESPFHYYQRPDADYVSIDSSATSLAGYGGRLALNKQKGNLSLNSAVGIISPGFDSNDLGFLYRTDVFNGHFVIGYHWYDPDGLFRNKGFNVATFRSFNFAGDKTGEGYFWFWNFQLMNYWSFDGNLAFSRAVIEPRITRGGPKMETTNGYNGYIAASTDSRQSIIAGMEVDGGRTESGGYRVTLFPSITWKPSSGLSLRFSPEINRDITIAQWVPDDNNPIRDSTMVSTFGNRYLFAKIDQREYSASIRVDWTWNPKLSFQLYLQPLISVGTYSKFKEFHQPGTYTFNTYGEDNNSSITHIDSTDSYLIDPDGTGSRNFTIGNPDFNFKSLRGNLVIRWEYLPGSTAYFVWTRSATRSNNPGSFDFGRDFGDMLSAPDHEDVFLIKLAYWFHP